ncbi:MAG TPA: HD domain-containing protein [Spirochaetia bacterium]|nr:HD domain-containing protein [Spirochaetia bacterium]
MESTTKDAAIGAMSDYFHRSTPKAEERIAHTLSVLSFAERILAGEGIDSSYVVTVCVLAALFHDIGIPEAERKHGSTEPRYQHEEGPPITRAILSRLKVRPDILERVCFIVGNHHSRGMIDSIDFQIVYEADYIVNTATAAKSEAGRSDSEILRRRHTEHLRTKTASTIIDQTI